MYLSDPSVLLVLKPESVVPLVLQQKEQILAHSAAKAGEGLLSLRFEVDERRSLEVLASAAAFGPHFKKLEERGRMVIRILPEGQEDACDPIELQNSGDSGEAAADVVLARRGSCTFSTKMRHAAQAGAVGIVVTSNDVELLTPSADANDLAVFQREQGEMIPLVLLPGREAEALTEFMSHRREGETLTVAYAGTAKLVGGPGGESATAPQEEAENILPKSNPKRRNKTGGRIESISEEDLALTPVVINGYWLVNCRLARP